MGALPGGEISAEFAESGNQVFRLVNRTKTQNIRIKTSLTEWRTGSIQCRFPSLAFP
jgi:hypothetical protein